MSEGHIKKQRATKTEVVLTSGEKLSVREQSKIADQHDSASIISCVPVCSSFTASGQCLTETHRDLIHSTIYNVLYMMYYIYAFLV